jgi:hypothetical protein
MSLETIYAIFKTNATHAPTGRPLYIAHRCMFDIKIRAALALKCPEYIGYSNTFQRAQMLVGSKGHVCSSWNDFDNFDFVFRLLSRHLG